MYASTTWQIRFTIDNIDQSGTYKLRLALASVNHSDLQVWIKIKCNILRTNSDQFCLGVLTLLQHWTLVIGPVEWFNGWSSSILNRRDWSWQCHCKTRHSRDLLAVQCGHPRHTTRPRRKYYIFNTSEEHQPLPRDYVWLYPLGRPWILYALARCCCSFINYS